MLGNIIMSGAASAFHITWFSNIVIRREAVKHVGDQLERNLCMKKGQRRREEKLVVLPASHTFTCQPQLLPSRIRARTHAIEW